MAPRSRGAYGGFSRVAEFPRPEPNNVTEVLGPVGDGATAVVTAVGFPGSEYLIAPRRDAVGTRFHDRDSSLKDLFWYEYRSEYKNGKSVDESRQIAQLQIE